MTGPGERRALWLALGGAVGLAGALALITLALRRPKAPPPPVAPVVAAQLAAPEVTAVPVLSPVSEEGTGPLTAPAAIVAPDVRARPAQPESSPRPRTGRMAAPIDIDGTPMIPEY